MADGEKYAQPLKDHWKETCTKERILEIAKNYLATSTKQFESPSDQCDYVVSYISYELTKDTFNEIEIKMMNISGNLI